MNVARMLLMLLRVLAGVQVLLGVGLWTGWWYSLAGLHMVAGVVFVLALWIIAAIALFQRRTMGLAAFALVWGLVVVALGMTQQRIVPGDLHWIVRVLHLVVGLASMPMAEKLAPAKRLA
jgi:hypothetical protein